jgi:dTDP-glucose pyrophosphorylase
MQGVTGGAPKELLPLGSKPVLFRVLEEARLCDPDEIVVITSEAKTEMNEALEQWIRGPFADLPIRVEYQRKQNGAAPAVALAEVEDDAVILFGDSVYWPESPVQRMSNLVFRGIEGCIAVEQVGDADVSRYGIAEIDEATGRILRLLEKPAPNETKSRWAVAGRIALGRSLMEALNHAGDTWGGPGELAVPHVLARAIAEGADVRAIAAQEDQQRVDCGSPEEYALALRQPWD